MIAKGNFHAHGGKLAVYLVKGHPGEKAELVEARGFRSSDLREAFRDIEIEARGTRAETAFFHCYTRLAPGETLTAEQWREIADREERRLGFTGQPRAISFHVKRDTGEKHMHIAWSRIGRTEDGHLFAIDPGLYKNKLKEFCREYELKFALRQVTNERAADQQTRATGRSEFEESRRLDTDLTKVRNAIHDCLQRSDNGKSLNAALEAQGFILTKGDRRDCFVVIDQAGGHHALNKKLTGMTLAETRARLGDLDASALPSVDQAKTMQQHRLAAMEARQRHDRPEPARTAGQGNSATTRPQEPLPPVKPLGKTAGEIRMAWSLTNNGQQFAEDIAARGLHLIYVTAEQAKASQRTHDFARAIKRQSRILHEGFGVVDPRGNVTRIDQRATGAQGEEIQKRLGGIDRDKLMSLAEAREDMREKNQAAFRARTRSGEVSRERRAGAAAQAGQARGDDRGSPGPAGKKGRDGPSLSRMVVATISTIFKPIEFLANFISAPPPPTAEQSKNNARAAAAQDEQQARVVKPAAEQEARFQEIREQQARDRRRQRDERGLDQDHDRDR